MDPQISRIVKRTLWNGRDKRRWEFFCPNCKEARRTSLSRHPWNATSIFQVLLTSVLFTGLTFVFWGYKGIVIAVPLAAAYEFSYRVRARSRMDCPHCGFNPYLYSVDVQSARRQIEVFWRKKLEERGIPYPEKTESKSDRVDRRPPEASL